MIRVLGLQTPRRRGGLERELGPHWAVTEAIDFQVVACVSLGYGLGRQGY